MKPFSFTPPNLPTLATALALALATTVSGCREKSRATEDKPAGLAAASVRTIAVFVQTNAVFEEFVGTVTVRRRAALEPKVGGRIETLSATLGRRVAAGEVIATLDAPEVRARLDQAKAELERAGREWSRASALFEQQAMTRADRDSAETRRLVAEGAVAEAAAMMEYAKVTAPFAGVISRKWAEAGDLALPGKPIVTLDDADRLQLEADIPESLASGLGPGAAVVLRPGGGADDVTSRVTEVSPVANPTIKAEWPDGVAVTPGGFARMRVRTGERTAFVVPSAAVFARGGLDTLFIVQNGRARLQLVKAGERRGANVEILSGLHAGDVAVTEGAALLADGQPLEVK
jgi:RND family efflux transporter MFP subunit